MLQGDEMADAVRIVHRCKDQFVPEQLAVLAVVAQHHMAPRALADGLAQARQLMLMAIIAQ
ncbi:hypothetical protein D9M68_870500 [compost metagenome]